MIDPTHPTVRAMAEEIVDEISAINRDIAIYAADEVAYLLVEFTRPATRDSWVRWGIEHYPALTWAAIRDDPDALEAAVSAALLR